MVILDRLELDGPKTKSFVAVMDKLTTHNTALVLLAEKDENVERSARNLADVKTLLASYLNVRDLLGYQKIVLPLAALEVISGFLAMDDDGLATASGAQLALDEEE
jgi:large subunit ribosomal protein L4